MSEANLQAKLELAKLRRQYRRSLALAFDASDSASRPTAAQQSILTDTETLVFWILGGNRTGKSTLGARQISWWFNGDHPYMERPKEWGNGPLQLLVVGRLGEQMESELWERKLKPFMQEGTYRAVRIGNILQRVVHNKTGNRIIFLSHHDAENAREKVQAFTTDVVWLDEMPDHAGLVTELVMRVVSRRGRLYGTFTPLLKNEDIRKIVDTPTSVTRKVQLSMLDNPIYRGREAETIELVRAACTSESEFRARMYGDWYFGDARVFAYSASQHKVPLPGHYSSASWRHLAVLDPAASGLAGLTVYGEDPEDGRWYNVLAKYLKGAAAFDLLAEVERHVRQFGNLTRRCDCNPSGFYKEAQRQGVPWLAYTDKNDRKLETIEKANTRVLQGHVFLTEASEALEAELVKAVWSERDPNKIAGASSYHLADTWRYACDLFPAWVGPPVAARTGSQQVRDQWQSRQRRKAAATKMQIHQRRGQWKSRSSSSAH